MQVRHLVIAVLLASAGAAQAQSVAPQDTVRIPAPAPLVLQPEPAAIEPMASEVAEPSSLALLLAGAIGVGALRRRRAK